MNEFWITCPVAGTRVTMGVKATSEFLAEPFCTTASLMTCPACGKGHVWTPRGAVVLEEQFTGAERPQPEQPSPKRRKKCKPEKPIEIIGKAKTRPPRG